MKRIEIFHCFDHNYVLPAGVSFYSLLAHARKDANYVIHVIAPDLTSDDEEMLCRSIRRYANAELRFHVTPELPFETRGILRSTHFAESLFYKMMIPTMTEGSDRVIVSDVDVVYSGDIVEVLDMVADDESFYVAAPWDICYSRWHGVGLVGDGKICLEDYAVKYTQEERDKLMVCAGLMVFNVKNILRDDIHTKWIDNAKEHVDRLILPEQDVFNLVCYPNIHPLPWRTMAYSYAYPTYVQMTEAERKERPVWDEMFRNPIQIHYAARDKPWQFPNVPMGDRWFEACAQAGLMADWCAWYGDFSREMVGFHNRRKFIDWSIDVCKRHYDISISQRVWRNPHSLLKSIRKDQ